MAPLTTEVQGDVVPIEEPPTWAAPLIAALKQGQTARLSVTISKRSSTIDFTWWVQA